MKINLDGTWLLAIDPGNIGREEKWFHHAVPGAKPTKVPWAIQDAFPGYHGAAWYWRQFSLPEPMRHDRRYLLRFWAVDYLAEVWLNGIPIGRHEGGETPFILDATDAIKTGEPNRLAVRVLNPTNEPIDGITLAETPHRNKSVPHHNGGSYNYGGILESVEILITPQVRFQDMFARTDIDGSIDIQLTLHSHLSADATGLLQISIAPAAAGETLLFTGSSQKLSPGETHVACRLQLEQVHLWQLDDPFLYRVTARLQVEEDIDEISTRAGFREFRIKDGYFHLNGRRTFVKSTHTGNHCPVGQVVPPLSAPNVLRQDLLYAKASGFNMVRFIAGVAHPWQLDFCDEIGLMVYEESLAGWCLEDSPQMVERFDRSLKEMILRDRNHPSVVVWGLLNETPDGPVFRQARSSLPLVRSLDDTRLVILGSGRWDCQWDTGSVSNPGSQEWEHVWGEEAPGVPPAPNTWDGKHGGYFQGAGDAHVYPAVPHPPETLRFIRALGAGSKPVFLSEYGIGSLMNAVRELRLYEQSGENTEAEDARLMRSMAERFTADWERYGMEGVYPFPEDMLQDSQRMHARQRLLGFDLIRSNPNICGFNLTGMLDHGMTGEGVWTFWREWKPGVFDAMRDGWSSLRWCLFADPMHGYTGRTLRVEVVLANEDVLPAGSYPACIKISGPSGIVWERKVTLDIPKNNAPFALPVCSEDITLNAPSGIYELAATLDRGGAPAGGRLRFYLSEPLRSTPFPHAVVQWGIDERTANWLREHGIGCLPYDVTRMEKPCVILAGDVSAYAGESDWKALASHMDRGSAVLFLSPEAFRRGDDPVGWLPLAHKGRGYRFNDWLYHKECMAKAHPAFEGLQARGIMDPEYYGPVIPHFIFEGQDTPEEAIVTAYAIGYPCPGGYTSGLLLGSYRHGAGRFYLNSLNILENIGSHPAADRLLMNLIGYATKGV